MPPDEQATWVSVTGCEKVTVASGGSDGRTVWKEKPLALAVPPAREVELQRLAGTRTHADGVAHQDVRPEPHHPAGRRGIEDPGQVVEEGAAGKAGDRRDLGRARRQRNGDQPGRRAGLPGLRRRAGEDRSRREG